MAAGKICQCYYSWQCFVFANSKQWKLARFINANDRQSVLAKTMLQAVVPSSDVIVFADGKQ